MSAASKARDENAQQPKLGWAAPTAALVCYTLAVIAATWPSILSFSTHLPSLVDPVQHLWVMRWYKTCLLEGRSPLVCPDIQYPVGAPLANFSPLHLQVLLYLPLSMAIDNDVLCYNLLWMFGFLFTGLATFLLAWHVLNDRAGAILAGLLAMLSGPMLIHSHAHLELIYVGGFPLFLLAWIRFVDRPSRARLVSALGAFSILAMSAAYFLVFALFPSGLYVGWQAVRSWRRGEGADIRPRIRWLLAFVLLSLPVVLVLFAPQITNLLQGGSLSRPRAEFDRYGAPWWSYFVPSHLHGLSRILPVDLYSARGQTSESISYLGLVTIGLLGISALARVRFRGVGYWWVLSGVLVVLSFGSTLAIGNVELAMPSAWLRDGFFAFRMIRVPARFNLFSAVALAVLTGSGLKWLRERIPGRIAQGGLVCLLGVLAVADLAHVPYTRQPPLEPPGSLAWIRSRTPNAAILDVPQASSGHPDEQNAACAYWQSLSGLKTSSGYSGHVNTTFDNLLTWNSPFSTTVLASGHLARPLEPFGIDLIGGTHYLDYSWLYLKTHSFRYVVIHQNDYLNENLSIGTAAIKALMAEALVFEDKTCAVFDVTRLPPPTRGTIVTRDGWNDRIRDRGHQGCLTSRVAELAVYNPDARQYYRLGLDARALNQSRTVRLMSGLRELERWEIGSDTNRLYVSHPFQLSEGLGTLRLVSDGTSRLERSTQTEEIRTKSASLFVTGISLAPVPDPEPTNHRYAEHPVEGLEYASKR